MAQTPVDIHPAGEDGMAARTDPLAGDLGRKGLVRRPRERGDGRAKKKVIALEEAAGVPARGIAVI